MKNNTFLPVVPRAYTRKDDNQIYILYIQIYIYIYQIVYIIYIPITRWWDDTIIIILVVAVLAATITINERVYVYTTW